VARRAPRVPSRLSAALTPGQRRRRRRLDPVRLNSAVSPHAPYAARGNAARAAEQRLGVRRSAPDPWGGRCARAWVKSLAYRFSGGFAGPGESTAGRL